MNKGYSMESSNWCHFPSLCIKRKGKVRNLIFDCLFFYLKKAFYIKNASI